MAIDPKIEKFCEELKAAREYQNLELGRIAERSKISVAYLEKLEEGDWDFLPQPYVRSFLRTYANVLSMDVEEVLGQYDEITGIPPVPVDLTGGSYDRIEKKRKKPPPPKIPSGELVDLEPEGGFNFSESLGNLFKPPAVYWLAGVLVVVLILAGLALLPREAPVENEFRAEDPDAPAQVNVDSLAVGEAGTSDESVQDANTIVAENPPAPSPQPQETATQQPVRGRLSLIVKAKSECWFKIVMDQNEVAAREALLQPGETAVYRADSLYTVVFGNGGGVELELNGRDLGTPGIEGRRTTITVDRTGIRP